MRLPEVDDLEHESDIAELRRLLTTLGYDVVGTVIQRRKSIDVATVIGHGKLLELARYTGGTGIVPSGATPRKSKARDRFEVDEEIVEHEHEQEENDDADVAADVPHADVVVVDHEITPTQARHLDQATDAEVLDRTGVIVEIFHRHAQTRAARLQVEIARLSYVVPRLRAGAHGHDRQRGGVGGKGAGESNLELDKRKVRDRLVELREELDSIEREEHTRRERRRGHRRVGLVGYTNAGKSTLMRALTGSDVLVEDKLFATLGTTVRSLYPEATPKILVSDTVGFIKKLPHELVASFRSTLDEALEASVLLHVVDASDRNFRAQLKVTKDVLADIGAHEVPSMLVLNKIDRVDNIAPLKAEFPDAIMMSAYSKDDLAALRETIIAFFDKSLEEAVLFVPYDRGALMGDIRTAMRVVDESYEDLGTRLTVKGSTVDLERIRALLR